MDIVNQISLLSMSALYVMAGIYHFIKPKIFLSITPKWVPYPNYVNKIIGAIEIILGLALLSNATRHQAAIGIIALLIAVFPANIYHFQKARRKRKLVIPALIRLPLQALLISWAYTFV